MDYDALWDLPKLTHKPIRPPRSGHIGEYVYAERWDDLMSRTDDEHPQNYQLYLVLMSMPVELSQRHATVAATFVCWLGTNCGQSILWEAKNMKSRSLRGDYVAAWAINNRRISYINNGVRTIECMLAPDDHFGTNFMYGCRTIIRLPELSAADYEVVEHVAAWLGTCDGQRFISECEAEIKIRQDAVSRAESEKMQKRYKEYGLACE